jgi:hypothetical protein
MPNRRRFHESFPSADRREIPELLDRLAERLAERRERREREEARRRAAAVALEAIQRARRGA